jgi:transposase-like protein
MCHTRQNVSKKGRRERTGQENQEQRTRLLEHAAAISQADTATEALARLARWAAPWREQAPHSVATLERDFARTLVFYDLTGMDLTWRRTASW